VIRVRPGNVYVLTSFYFDDAYEAFKRLYRRYKGMKALVTPQASVEWMGLFSFTKFHGFDADRKTTFNSIVDHQEQYSLYIYV